MTAVWEYTVWDAFWTMLWFFLFFIWIWLLIMVFSDIFRSHDLSGWGKALWTMFVIVLPYLGVFVYLIARGKKMGEHAVRDAHAAMKRCGVRPGGRRQRPRAPQGRSRSWRSSRAGRDHR